MIIAKIHSLEILYDDIKQLSAVCYEESHNSDSLKNMMKMSDAADELTSDLPLTGSDCFPLHVTTSSE